MELGEEAPLQDKDPSEEINRTRVEVRIETSIDN